MLVRAISSQTGPKFWGVISASALVSYFMTLNANLESVIIFCYDVYLMRI